MKIRKYSHETGLFCHQRKWATDATKFLKKVKQKAIVFVKCWLK